MMIQEVIDGVEKIEAVKDDPESAHVSEDYLWCSVLTAIATGQCKDQPPEEFAAEALKTREIEFPRWYA